MLRPHPPAPHRMSIVDNKKAFHDYFIEERYEAGMVLEGWEVKSIRAGRAQLKEAYVIIRNERFFCSAHTSAPYQPRPPMSALTRSAPASCC